MRKDSRDPVDLALERRVVDGIDRPLQIILQEQPEHRVRRHEVDLETAILRHNSLPLQHGKFSIGAPGNICIEKVFEGDIAHRPARPEAVACMGFGAGMDAEHFVRFLQRGIIGEDRLQPGDPVAAFAGLAVGYTPEVRPQRVADRGKNIAGSRQRYAADQVHMTRHSGDRQSR